MSIKPCDRLAYATGIDYSLGIKTRSRLVSPDNESGTTPPVDVVATILKEAHNSMHLCHGSQWKKLPMNLLFLMEAGSFLEHDVLTHYLLLNDMHLN